MKLTQEYQAKDFHTGKEHIWDVVMRPGEQIRRGEQVRRGVQVRRREQIWEGEQFRRGEQIREGEQVNSTRLMGDTERNMHVLNLS